MSNSNNTSREIIVGKKYKLGSKIGSGSFGSIYKAVDITSGNYFAVKLEHGKTRHPQLEYESKVYRLLSPGAVGIPKVRWFGVEGDYNVMVIDLLGPSIEDLFNYCGRKLSLKSVLMLADQCLRRLEYVHSKNILHRDMKPDNFLVGIGQLSKMVYLIDFGLSKKYRDSKGRHLPYREGKSLTGTARYASIYTHLGIEQGRRDDLESLGYILLYLLQGQLPWQGLDASTKQGKYARISEKKLTTPVEQLCFGVPSEFATYINYSKAIRFADRPDYSYLRKMFRDLFIREGFQFDCMFDWTIKQNQEYLEKTMPRHIASKQQSTNHYSTQKNFPSPSDQAKYPTASASRPSPNKVEAEKTSNKKSSDKKKKKDKTQSSFTKVFGRSSKHRSKKKTTS
mmetsp:Transcript_5992/g.9328  ORF Transcript_5992/g.9328 Transcript_5992/m.9328 type:complete len:396 (+) Transcript_5992:23-1210(+)|eukprot:CAMPEP_0201548642 /NCGR_PEP_ID=MMETSP0173_2-20130828/5172_1 /ASSEMBLY_ACC=CAM_ASM_000268 /TAXON_ID=218659 /ORGANISM="Vexillifera sp., Strain DIVA3 564/2" /LENGTH=395 /DNA_ID=CAMNT_0047958079 /DNA_START=8 /DNA_END=1195 /DNA_ORIENTATION=+